MDENYSPQYEPNMGLGREEFEPRRPHMRRSSWFVFSLTVAIIGVIAAAYFYVSEERQRNRDLGAANQRVAASLAEFQAQLQSMSERLNGLQAQMAPPPLPLQTQRPTRARSTGEVSIVRRDPRLERLQNQVSKQQKEIAEARQDIDSAKSDLSRTRDDLQSNISSTKSELNGSIARTHDELVVLQKRGERNFYEFTIDKSKQFSRVGPMSIALRKADTKHKRFDMTILVDDNQLQKNGVSLYDTVSISLSDRPRPVELVVNKIDKNHIEGYVSEPKYKKSELQSSVSLNSTNNAAK
jgi:hypothetical protein